MIKMEGLVDDYVTGEFTFKELAAKYDTTVDAVVGELVSKDLPDEYSADYNGTRKRFPIARQNGLVMELLVDWFREQSKLRYISSADLLTEALRIKGQLKFKYLAITEGSVRGALQAENIRLMEQDHQPQGRQERKQLNDLMLEWFSETGKEKMMTMQMIYEQAQVYAKKIGLKTITKSRAFVDNFMRVNDIRISDTPYAMHYHAQVAQFKSELSQWCEEKRAESITFNKATLLDHARNVKAKYDLEDLTLTLSWAENFITKNGFFCKSGRDRYTQTLKTWYKRKDGNRVSLAELRNKCKHLADRCLSDEPDFINDEYLQKCLMGLTQGRTDALLPPLAAQTAEETGVFHDDIKVEIIETIRNEDDSELLTRLRTELLSWYNETIKQRRVQTADIYPQALQIASEIGLHSFETTWESAQFTNNFLRRNSIRLQQQPHLLTDEQSRIKQLKDRLATFFHEESEKRYLGSKDLSDFAEGLKEELSANVDLTRNWFGSFYKTYGIYLNQQKFVKLKEAAIDDLFNWYQQNSELGFISSEDILEKGKQLFDEAGLPFTYTSKKSFIEMFCSKKAIRLSKQPFYEVGRKNGDVSTVSIDTSLYNHKTEPNDEEKEKEQIPISVERELKADVAKWFQLESKYRYISIYDVITKSLEWAKLLGAVTQNDRILKQDPYRWVNGVLLENGIDVNRQTHAEGLNSASPELTEDECNAVLDTLKEMTGFYVEEETKEETKEEPGEESEKELSPRQKKSFEQAKKELEEWFMQESQLRYLSHRDILDKMKELYPGRGDLLTTTWVQNFCRHRPHMSVSKQKYGVSLTSLKAQLADWFNDEKQKYFISKDDLVERARELAQELDMDLHAVDHAFIRQFMTKRIKFSEQPFYEHPSLRRKSTMSSTNGEPEAKRRALTN